METETLVNELVTLDRKHPEFMAYLRGTFARDRRALPVRSLNVRTPTESVTFQITPVARIARPAWPVVWLKALRPRSFLLVLVPFLFVLSGTVGAADLDPDLPWIVLIGLVALHGAFLLRNDVQDHIAGFDRMRSDRGSRAIQSGWLSAAQLEKAAWGLLGVAVVCAGLTVFARPAVGVVVLAAALLGGFTFFRAETPFREITAGQFFFMLLGGPLLFAGLHVALAGATNEVLVGAGFLWGWIALFPVHLRDLENLIVEGQSGRASLVGRAGFDRSLKIIRVWWFVALLGFAVLQALIGVSSITWILLAALIVASGVFARRVRALRSPAGSEVARVRRFGEYLFVGLVFLWVWEAACRLLLR